VARTERPLTEDIKSKISLFTSVPKEAVVEAVDAETIYEIPLLFARQGVDEQILMLLRQRGRREPQMDEWKRMVEAAKNPKREVTVCVAGKYTELKDAYKSIWEALIHGGIAHQARVRVRYVDASAGSIAQELEEAGGVLVPGGFGDRGIEGKIEACRIARERGIPYLGLCLGMQVAAIETARNVAKLRRAHSTEFDPKTPHPVIDLLPEQRGVSRMGGSMRLGVYPCRLRAGSLAARVYGSTLIKERHRHRYELNNKFRGALERSGLSISGIYPPKNLAEIVERKGHPWFVAVQFHPEFQSRPLAPHPLFAGFVGAILARSSGTGTNNSGRETTLAAAGKAHLSV
jgi:CTP synthase